MEAFIEIKLARTQIAYLNLVIALAESNCRTEPCNASSEYCNVEALEAWSWCKNMRGHIFLVMRISRTYLDTSSTSRDRMRTRSRLNYLMCDVDGNVERLEGCFASLMLTSDVLLPNELPSRYIIPDSPVVVRNGQRLRECIIHPP